MLRRYLPFFIIAVVGLGALGTGVVTYRSKMQGVAETAHTVAQTSSVNEKSLHIRGDVKAPVTLEEFGDFQCPPCGGLSTVMAEVEREYGNRLRVIFRNLPLTMVHEHAMDAAQAAEAAGLQGKFWEMHDLLYRNQAAWSQARNVDVLFNAYASLAALDVKRFNADRASAVVKSRIAADQARATALKIANTPTILVNDQLLPVSALNAEGLRKAINDALSEKKKK